MTSCQRVRMLAGSKADAPAITEVRGSDERKMTWAGLASAMDAAARAFANHGVDEGSTVVVALRNGIPHFVAALGAWRLGAMVLPISAGLPRAERDAILDLATPRLVVSEWEDISWPTIRPAGLEDPAEGHLPDDPVPHPAKAIASGGSTGRPKIIVDPNRGQWTLDALSAAAGLWAGIGERETQLVAGPLYHNLGFSWAHIGLFLEHHLVVMERFDATAALALIERHRVTFAPVVPTMMRRMLLVPSVEGSDLSSLRCVFHSAAPCPEHVKQGWIDLIGAEKVYELYGATEATGSCVIRGDEWLLHRGSVGRPTADTEVLVVDDHGEPLPTGTVGEVFMRRPQAEATYTYVGSPAAKVAAGGFVSVGDLGWVDEDGYVFLADRRADLIITGGSNVYPAEVEVVLLEHPAVLDAAVVGLPDDDLGKRVHAVVELREGAEPASVHALEAHCRERLARYKVPRSFEVVDSLPRDESGKLRRSALIAPQA